MAEPRFRYERYAAPTGQEWMMVHGIGAPCVMLLPPLFGEANFTRALIVGVARRLATADLGVAIPDLPGTGESERRIEDIGWEDWRAAAAAAADHVAHANGSPPHLIALRGGALIDDACIGASRFRFAAATGASLLRQMERAQAIGDRESGRSRSPSTLVELTGYRLAPSLVDPLRAATPFAAAGALHDSTFAGPGAAPWRRAEPSNDAALAAQLASEVLDWIAQCGA